MKKEYLLFMCCPKCKGALSCKGNVDRKGKIEEGTIQCTRLECGESWPIRNYVPRFVENGKYANSFGAQWKTFARTQLDDSVLSESMKRWDSEIGWTKQDLTGKNVIEFGSGAGRFIDIVSRRRAGLAVGIDITDAVDASQNNLGQRDNIFFIQADFFMLPLKEGYFDFAYSIGVLHHTPEPEEGFNKMVAMLNKEGEIGLCLYEISMYRRPNLNSFKVSTVEVFWALNLWRTAFFRMFTTRIPDKVFLLYCKKIVPFLHYLNKIPVLRYLRYLLPCTCYRYLPVEWSMVDTNDTYSTKIVHKYRHKDIFQWFMAAKLQDIIIHNSMAGWVSLTASVNREKQHLDYSKYLHTQPSAPGINT